MMEVVLTRLRDFSCKSPTFDERQAAGTSTRRDPPGRPGGLSEGRHLGIESALAWLRRELVRRHSGVSSTYLCHVIL